MPGYTVILAWSHSARREYVEILGITVLTRVNCSVTRAYISVSYVREKWTNQMNMVFNRTRLSCSAWDHFCSR